MASPILVHVVEDKTALYATGSALGGVALGAAATWLQQRSKIGADQAQMKERLITEEKWLDRRLTHEREMQEREALRAVLDDAMEAARVAYNRALTAIRESAFGEQFEPGSVGLAGSKLVIRLGRTHPVVDQFRELRDALDTVRNSISAPLGLERPSTRAKACFAELEVSGSALERFADAAASLVGSPLAAAPRLEA